MCGDLSPKTLKPENPKTPDGMMFAERREKFLRRDGIEEPAAGVAEVVLQPAAGVAEAVRPTRRPRGRDGAEGRISVKRISSSDFFGGRT